MPANNVIRLGREELHFRTNGLRSFFPIQGGTLSSKIASYMLQQAGAIV